MLILIIGSVYCYAVFVKYFLINVFKIKEIEKILCNFFHDSIIFYLIYLIYSASYLKSSWFQLWNPGT